jgi:hypothetical protein
MLKKTVAITAGLALAAIVLTLAFTATTNATATVSPKVAMATRLWKMSGHGDKTDVPFNNWNSAGSIPTTCAKCHSTPGFLDFLGADGTPGGTVENTAKIGTTIECLACHTSPAGGILRQNPSVQFPSGVVVNNMGPEGLCMECHQGRASKQTVDAKIAGSGVPNDDTSSTKLSFSDVHYYAAAATQMGTVVQAGYEYAGKIYDARFSHITGYNACNTCHDPHSLEVNIKGCNTCHVGVKDPKDIRFVGSQTDYDGSGDLTEGMYYVIQNVMAKLYATIQRYARTVLNNPIGYDGTTYPYWFYDTNGNGAIDGTENASTNNYTAFSARLLKAAYNYQVATKDPNNFAHNGKYIIELLYDSIADLNTKLAAPTDLSAMHREDEPHFDGASLPYRDWDTTADYMVPTPCSRCHSAAGLADYLASNQTAVPAEPVANGMLCTTCHTAPPELRTVTSVIFPSGLSATLGDASNICMICHQGRAAKVTIDAAIAAKPAGPFSVSNIHYFPEAAIFLGTEVQGGYEFPGKTYAGRQPYTNHGGRFNTCIECHMSSAVSAEEHSWTMRMHNVADPMKENCVPCHGNDISQPIKGANPETFDFEKIRPGDIPDYDADGNITESLKDEIAGLEVSLDQAIRQYVLATAGVAIIFNFDDAYYYKDLNGNGILDANEIGSSNRYSGSAAWLKATYNLRVSRLALHGFIHNARYVAQLLVDSMQSVGVDIAKYTWR